MLPAMLPRLHQSRSLQRLLHPRVAQLDAMLGDQEWERVAVFACSCVQCRSLDLPPWQSPVFRASLRDLDKPYGDPSGKRESAELLKRLLDANLSPFEPDPLAAIAEAEAKRQPAT